MIQSKPTKGFTTYRYFDTPDGEDIMKKAWYTSKYSGAIAMFCTVQHLIQVRPKTDLDIIVRLVSYAAPLIGISTAFVVVTNMSTNIRRKDDKLNWVLGAVTSGTLFGMWRRSKQLGFFSCIALSGAAILKKHAVDNNWVFFPPIRQLEGGPFSCFQDQSLFKERPRTWTDGTE